MAVDGWKVGDPFVGFECDRPLLPSELYWAPGHSLGHYVVAVRPLPRFNFRVRDRIREINSPSNVGHLLGGTSKGGWWCNEGGDPLFVRACNHCHRMAPKNTISFCALCHTSSCDLCHGCLTPPSPFNKFLPPPPLACPAARSSSVGALPGREYTSMSTR